MVQKQIDSKRDPRYAYPLYEVLGMMKGLLGNEM